MPKAFAAQFSDLAGPPNPTGILSPAFLSLKQAIDRSDEPDNVLQALYDWLSQMKIEPLAVDRILGLSSLDAAYDALVGLVGGKLSPQGLPDIVQQTLRRAIQRLAQKHVERGEQELGQARKRLTRLWGRYGLESAPEIVRRLITS